MFTVWIQEGDFEGAFILVPPLNILHRHVCFVELNISARSARSTGVCRSTTLGEKDKNRLLGKSLSEVLTLAAADNISSVSSDKSYICLIAKIKLGCLAWK